MSDTKDLLKMVMKWLLVPGPKRKKCSELTNEDSDYSKHIFQTVNTNLLEPIIFMVYKEETEI